MLFSYCLWSTVYFPRLTYHQFIKYIHKKKNIYTRNLCNNNNNYKFKCKRGWVLNIGDIHIEAISQS